MSSTRVAKPGSPLRQERFASSKAYRKGLLGNLVAKRCRTIKAANCRSLVLFLHDVSLRETRERHYSCNLFPQWPWPSTSESEEGAFERLAREVCEFFPDRCAERARKHLPAAITRLCLDPELVPERATVPGCTGLYEVLCDYRLRFEQAAFARFAKTETATQIFDLLEYSSSQRCLVVAEGPWRTGKSHACQAWAQAHLGTCRYVQLSSARDDLSFYRDIARALGVSTASQFKACELRARVDSVLREQHLALVVDEADWVWPQAVRARESPQRLNWILTSLINNGVPVALIGSRNFSRMEANLDRKCPVWGKETWQGRIKLRRRLPDVLSETDLFALASVMMPRANEPARMLAVAHALNSEIPVSDLESIASRATYLAAKTGEPLGFRHVESAMREAGTLPIASGRISDRAHSAWSSALDRAQAPPSIDALMAAAPPRTTGAGTAAHPRRA